MKKKLIWFGLFTTCFIYGRPQQSVNPGTANRVSKSSIELVYSQYLGNGDHSAITGGTGTEKLIVYEPELILKHQIDTLRSSWVDAGIDVITSASMDNIDFVKSSASRVSKRGYVTTGYETKLKKNNDILVGGSGYFSIESAYLSVGAGLSAVCTSKDKSREFSAELNAYFDDLLWGRLNGERPLKLVYPVELRDTNWDTKHNRDSYNLNISFSQTINKRMLLAFLPGFIYQQGLLSTPYHRVYFSNGFERVERLPDKRWKLPLGIQLNSFIGDRYVLRSYYGFYYDNFGIAAHTVELALAAKLSLNFTLTPSLRLYTQRGSSFFEPYKKLNIDQEYYTSNYDFSSFNSYEAGMEFRWAGLAAKKAGFYFDELGLRYSFYRRSDGLYGHLITLVMDMFYDKHQHSIH